MSGTVPRGVDPGMTDDEKRPVSERTYRRWAVIATLGGVLLTAVVHRRIDRTTLWGRPDSGTTQYESLCAWFWGVSGGQQAV